MREKVSGLTLTKKHVFDIHTAFNDLGGISWSLESPIFLFDRSWLRLVRLRLSELNAYLPPDKSAEAPELIHYHRLLSSGIEPLLALQQSWHEFGMEDFYRAIRNYWNCQDLGNRGWTYKTYIDTLSKYRNSFEVGKLSIPFILLAREASYDDHRVAWINKEQSQSNFEISYYQ